MSECVTADEFAAVVDECHQTKAEDILLTKCRSRHTDGATHGTDDADGSDGSDRSPGHGDMFRPIAVAVYSHMYATQVHRVDPVEHPRCPRLVATPDGITADGVVLGVQCPITRRPTRYKPAVQGRDCGDNTVVPHQYYAKAQLELECCDLDMCDFLECQVRTYESDREFYADSRGGQAFISGSGYLKGVAVRYRKIAGTEYCYCYAPSLKPTVKEMMDWIGHAIARCPPGCIFDRVVYWELKNVFCFRIYRDNAFVRSRIPKVNAFWRRVVETRLTREAACHGHGGQAESADNTNVCVFCDSD